MCGKKGIWIGFACLCALGLTTPADAVEFVFKAITNNSPTAPAIGESQLSVDVIDAGVGEVLFSFSNIGPKSCSITDIYMDDGTLLGIASIFNTPGLVEFSAGAKPSNLPGGQDIVPVFEATAAFSVDSDSPTQAMGVNPGETLGITYSLQSGGTYADVIDELYDGRLRIGLHVQGFDDGASEAFVHHVPEPATVTFLALFSLFGMSGRRRNAVR